MKYYPGHPYIERIIENAAKNDHAVIDGFAGTGGVSEGFENAEGFYPFVAINHWHEALASHELNHPNCLHLEEDFRTADLDLVVYMVNEIRRRNPFIKIHIWLSLECTNFSNAKGGMPRDPDSRTLADSVHRYVEVINPDIIWIENVKEFMLWGPMIPKVKYDEDGYEYCPLVVKKTKNEKSIKPWLVPDPQFKGRDFYRWIEEIKKYGYDCHHSLMNMANYGVPQHRIRLIMQFTRNGVPAVYPKPTHDKYGRHGLIKWVAVKTCLDLDDEGDSVLSFKQAKKGKWKGRLRPRVKSEKTIDRLIAGCIKHALNGDTTWLVQHYSNEDANKNISIDSPSRAITGTAGNLNVAHAKFLQMYYSQGQTDASINQPSPLIPTKDRISINTVKFLDKQYGGNDYNHQSIEDTSGVVTGNPKLNLASIFFIDHSYSQGQKNKSIEEPSGGIVGNPKQRVTNVKKFIMDTQFDHMAGHSLDDVAKTVTANRKHYYIITAQFNNPATSIENPSATILARMDKKPPYLVIVETGQMAIEIFDHDPEHYVKLKKFMAENGIIEIKMRMLKEVELKKIMTIPENYQMTGNATDRKKMIGNAVPPDFVTVIANEYAAQNPATGLRQSA